MKVALFTVVLIPLICGAAEPPLLPTTEGTTWNYDLVQEKMSGDFDLTEPNEEEHLAVTYRLGGIEKIDNKDLRRLEIYRGNTLESVDLIAVEERGIICPARTNSQGAITKLIPPQILLSAPLKTGSSWNFDGTIAGTKVNQRYEIAGREDVDLPAGKFRAWRIHCEQTSPAPATIDRWFVRGTGFVKVETVVKAPSGGVLQRTSLRLKELPKVASAPQKNPAPKSEKLSVGLSKEPAGDFLTTFASNTAAIYVRWKGRGLRAQAEIRVVWIAENVSGVTPGYAMDEASTVAPTPSSTGRFTLDRPAEGWAPGNYRVEFYVDDALAGTVKFKISE